MFYYMDLIRLDFVFFTNLTDIYTMSTKNYNPRQCKIEMSNLNAS